jgi:hypothetical protein
MSEQPQQQQRQCDECKQLLPLIPENFARVAGTVENFEFVCRPCKRALKDKAKMAQMETEAVSRFLDKTTNGGSNIPHTAEMLESLMQGFGGVNGFTAMCMKQYFDAPSGGRLRNSLLEMVVRLTSKNTEQGGAKKPLSLLTEEELEAELDKRMQMAVLVHEGRRVIDAEPIRTSDLHLSDGRTEGTPAGVIGEEIGGSAVVQADAAAIRVSPVNE